MSSTIRIAVLANASQANRELAGVSKNLDRVSDSAGKQESKLQKYGRLAQGAFAVAGAGVAAFGLQAIKSASDAEQSLGATQAVFGKTADTIIKKSNEAADNYGLSANSYRESANLIGSLFKNQGVATEKLAGQTDKMISFGSDLAAVFGGTTKDAVEALGAAFKGEYDPLEAYGISLQQSTVNSEAFAVAGVKTQSAFDKLTPKQQKVAEQQATVNLLFKQGKDSIGQFAAQTGTTAEQVQIARAKFDNLTASLGVQLLPVVNKVLGAGIKLLDWLKKNPAAAQAAAAGIGVLVVGLGALAIAAAVNPFTLVVAGLALLAAGLVLAWKKSQTFREVTSTALAAAATLYLKQTRVMLQAMKVLTDGILKSVEGILRALGKIPGNDWADRAADNVAKFRRKVDGEFNGAIQKTRDWEAAVNRMPKEIKLKGDIKDLDAKIQAGKAKLRSVPPGHDTTLRANIRDLEAKASRARAELAKVQGKSVTVSVFYRTVGAQPNTFGNGLGVNKRASGGSVVAGRAYIVGENRPELFVPGTNGSIVPRVGGGGGDTFVVNFNNVVGDPAAVGREIERIVNKSRNLSGRPALV